MARRSTGGMKRVVLSLGTSALAIGCAAPVSAQVTMVRSVRNIAAQAVGQVVGIGTTLVRSPTMQQALTNQASHQAQIVATRSIVLAARNAAIAATRLNPADGLSTSGLDPIQVVKDAIAHAAAGDAAGSNALLAGAAAVNDPSGKATWEGAGLPNQTTDTAGNVTVTINQTQARALLSWNKFDIGAKTTLAFGQSQNGIAQTGWTVVNRVVDAIAPSTILGKVTAPGTVVVLNSQGVIFGQNSQVNTQSLLVSTLELGSGLILGPNGVNTVAAGLQARNSNYLQNGLFATASAGEIILSPDYAAAGLVAASNIDLSFSQVPLEGSVVLDAGAQITAGLGGTIIIAAPSIDSSAHLSAFQGQVSLQAGRIISAIESTGAGSSSDPNVRGFLLRSFLPGRDAPANAPTSTLPDDGYVVNRGVIESAQGYISLGAGLLGTVENDGLLSATTTVSRNGKIDLIGGMVRFGSESVSDAAGVVSQVYGSASITPDEDGETIPQGDANNPPGFKSSQIVIGTYGRAIATDLIGTLTPGQFTMGQNTLIYAPNANVVIGRKIGAVDPLNSTIASGIDILDGAIIDVSGLKDVQLAASVNSVAITPVKKNELRDTPNYREVAIDDNFSLNGTTLYIDPRVSGIRADGVAWVGSPLIEAASIVAQLPVTASELMTKGGTVTLAVNGIGKQGDPLKAPHIAIATAATIDISGGWVNYAAGLVQTSNLITADGQLVNISKADPNGDYIGVATGYSQSVPSFGATNTFINTLQAGSQQQPSYDEGRDAGALVITASAINLAGTIDGQAFAGARQLAQALLPSGTGSFGAGQRSVQASKYQLPVGGAVQIGSFPDGPDSYSDMQTGPQTGLGADIVVYTGTRNTPASYVQTLLSADMLSASGISDLTLQTSGAVTFAGGSETLLDPAAVTLGGASNLTLAAGGVLKVQAGRTIAFNGTITVPAGTVSAQTFTLATAKINVVTDDFAIDGSPFTNSDDLLPSYGSVALANPLFDINVNGVISTAGRFSNDLLVTNGLYDGAAWQNGGSISLTVAPDVFAAVSSDGGKTVSDYADLSGSINIASRALLDVSAGAYVATTGAVATAAKGGSISLTDATIYDQIDAGYPNPTAPGFSVPLPVTVPAQLLSHISFAESSLKAFGFTGSGSFNLVSPMISFGSTNATNSSHISLGFLQNTGFGALSLASLQSVVVPGLFNGGAPANFAFLTTTDYTIKAGETFDLTQSLLPDLLGIAQLNSLRVLASGGTLTSVLTPSVPTAPWDQLGAKLTIGGLGEFDVAAGGTLTGAPQASVTVPTLYNAGSIILHGGTIVQQEILPNLFAEIGVPLVPGASLGTVFGAANANGQYDPHAINGLNLSYAGNSTALYTNLDLATTGAIYFLGKYLAPGQGVVLAAGSMTDLSGMVITNPYASIMRDGTRVITGRLIAGGSLSTAANGLLAADYFATPVFTITPSIQLSSSDPDTLKDFNTATLPGTLNVLSGATLDLSGTSASFDIATSATSYALAPQWSDAGTLSALSGGTIAGATILASGGAPAATGGTLEWLDPTLTDHLTGTDTNRLLTSQIQTAGFDTLIARGGLTVDGPAVSLNLRKALFVESAPRIDPTATNPADATSDVTISATANTQATLAAGYVQLASLVGRVGGGSTLPGATGNASVTLNAGALGMDVFGAVLFDGSIANTQLTSTADLRLTGVNTALSTDTPVLNGELVTQGNLTIDAARTYATTGTGNLQQILENLRANVALPSTALPFEIDAFGNSTILFKNTYINNSTPLSAGSYLRVQAQTIIQGGYLAAPLGILELGGNGAASIAGQASFNNPGIAPRAIATTSLTFGAGSVTSVSGANVTVGGVATKVPYGTTTNLAQYYFTPTDSSPITSPPTGEFILTGGAINVNAGATLDGTGGGDVFAYEFVSGTGGSRDVLSRFNTDQYSADHYNAATGTGYQYADERQVYAIVPADQASKIAYYDPIYSADYTAAGPVDLYGAAVGESVHLDGGNGIAAGDYVLLPAHYALLPGAYRIVENTGSVVPYAGTSSTLLDGSIVMGGTFGTAGVGLADSIRYSFTIQPQATFLKSADLAQTAATTTLQTQAEQAGNIVPQLPIDSARVILSPLTSLKIDGALDLAPAAGGLGAKIDIAGTDIIVGAIDPGTPGALFLANTTLANLNANSLFIGGQRQDNADGTTTLNVTADAITVDGDAAVSGPELLFAVGAIDALSPNYPALTIANGASLTATGALSDPRSGDYIIPSNALPPVGSPYALTGIGAALRVSTGSERLFQRQGAYALRNTLKPAKLVIGAATLTGTDIALDSSRNFKISNLANFAATNIGVSGDTIDFGPLGIGSEIEAKFAAAAQLTLRSPGAIRFSNGTYAFNNLTIDAPALSRLASPAQQRAVADVTLIAKAFDWYNTATGFGGCTVHAATSCGTPGSTLTIAADTITLGSGNIGVYGFNKASTVNLAATSGVYIAGTGSLAIGNIAGSAAASDSALVITAPFIVDSSAVVDPLKQKVKVAYSFATRGAFSLVAPTLAVGAAQAVPTGNRAPGATIAIGSVAAPVASVVIDSAAILATAGTLDITSKGNIALAGAASLQVPGYSKTFGDNVDSTTVSAGGGTLTLTSLAGNIVLPTTASLVSDTGVGNAGALNLLASEGGITFAASLNPGVVGPRASSLVFDAQTTAFDLAGFVSQYGIRFEGDLDIRAGVGNLTLNAGQTITASSVNLTADGSAAGAGQITIAGTIDTSGQSVAGMNLAASQNINVNGGNIALYGNNGLTLAATALLDTHTTGYLDSDTRQAIAGNVTLGIASQSAVLDIAAGAMIDVGANRPSGQVGNRLVAQTVVDPASLTTSTVYRLAQADTGGTVLLRAPVDAASSSQVNIVVGSTLPITGAASIQIEGFKTYDLDALAQNAGIVGVIGRPAGVTLNLTKTSSAPGVYGNLLADYFVIPGTAGAADLQSIPYFIQNFAITTAAGGSFDPAIELRPGVVLASAGSITLASNWNLGAGLINFAKAEADGDAVAHNLNGWSYAAVVPGQEASLLQNDTHMIYRVGTGYGNIANAAPIITLQAAKTLTADFSITDGFFTFRDTTNPTYTDYALGGGKRSILPAVTLTCRANDCSNAFAVGTLASVAQSIVNHALDPTQIVNLNLTTFGAGADITSFTAPLTQQANSVSFANQTVVQGDPMSAAEVFPLLNGGTTYAKSSSLRLVGGAGAFASADPLHVDAGSNGDVIVDKEHSYVLNPKKAKDAYSTDLGAPVLDLALLGRATNFTGGLSNAKYFISADANSLSSLINIISTGTVNFSNTLSTPTGDEYTVINWGPLTTPLANYLRTAAASYFNYVSYQTATTSTQPNIGIAQMAGKVTTGVAASLIDVLGFLSSTNPKSGQTVAQTIAAGVVSHAFAATPPVAPNIYNLGIDKTVYYGSLVRTGDGTIDVAAARDVKLTRTNTVVYRRIQDPSLIGPTPAAYQVGGTAIYTVGHIVTSGQQTASTADGAVKLDIGFAQSPNDVSYLDGGYLPSALQESLTQPDLLEGGGSITILAGRDVIGRRDEVAQQADPNGANVFIAGNLNGPVVNSLAFATSFLGGNGNNNTSLASRVGSASQLWRVGEIGQDTLIGAQPNLFTSGVGALGGGDITMKAGGDVTELTVALDTSVVTANAIGSNSVGASDRFATLSAVNDATQLPSAPVMATIGGGNLDLTVGGSLFGGLVDVASGQGTIAVGGDIAPDPTSLSKQFRIAPTYDLLRFRVADADISASVNGSVAMTGINALGTGVANFNSAGFFSPVAGLNLVAEGSISFAGDAESAGVNANVAQTATGFVLPPTLNLVALSDNIVLGTGPDLLASVGRLPYLLYPSAVGQLSLLSGGSISNTAIAMLDSDPSLLPGAFSAYMGPGMPGAVPTANSLGFAFPVISPTTADGVLRLYHDSAILHAGDPIPVRIYVAGSLTDINVLLPKQARISAGKDILDVYFQGQNLGATDTTRITAGRDISGTTRGAITSNGNGTFSQYVLANNFILGGPGTFDIEAGRNLGPFISSSVVAGVSYAGGIRSVGNDFDPWLPSTGADITVAFGIGNGADYAALRETYLDPANSAQLDGALFVQVADVFGNERPDRTEPIYAPLLAAWLATNDPLGFTSVFGVAPSALTGAALTAASYPQYDSLYAAFAQLNQIDQNRFLINTLYFKELAAPADVTSPSFHQYIRGYRAVQTLFPTSLGYTDNLATYTTDPATISADHPLGVPVRNLVNGQPEVATRVITGNADLRLSTIETDRGGGVTILGPGGNFIDGSVVRTSAEIAGNATTTTAPVGATTITTDLAYGAVPSNNIDPSAFTAIPQGFEGVLTLRGGAINDFTDGNFEVNQSRVFTQAGGDITMWSSNGDLNAGEGPKSASNFPPITVDFTPDGGSEVNSAGSVSGAGIGAFQAAPTDPLASIYLLAPAGTVDAGDAGVRASGNVVVAAARVANADNFKAGGSITGVPTGTAAAAPVTPASATSALVANVARITDSNQIGNDKTIITVEVTDLGCSIKDKDDKNPPAEKKDDKTC